MKISTSADHLPNFSQSKTEVDLSYLEQYGSRDNYQIPTCFSKCNFTKGQSFEARVTHIYDLSKFWIVTKFREMEIFQRCLFRFYYTHRNRTNYRIPQEKIELNLYCVAFADNAYYRAVIIGFPDLQQKEPEVQLYFIDYGMVGSTTLPNIFYMSENFMKVSQFAVKARLAYICPLDNCNWTSEVVYKFSNLVVDKILIGTAVNIDSKREILEVYLSPKGPHLQPIHEVLIKEKNAQYFHERVHDCEEKSRLGTKIKYPYLFPTHEALQSGKLPLNVSDAEYQLQIAPLSTVLTRYYGKTTMEMEIGTPELEENRSKAI